MTDIHPLSDLVVDIPGSSLCAFLPLTTRTFWTPRTSSNLPRPWDVPFRKVVLGLQSIPFLIITAFCIPSLIIL